MNTDEKIYVVTQGSYSDYHIEKIFLNKEKADLYCSCHNGCSIEEWNCSDDMLINPVNELMIRVCFRFPKFPDGTNNIQGIEFNPNNIIYSIDKKNEHEFGNTHCDCVFLGFNDINIILYRKVDDATLKSYKQYNIIPSDIKSKYNKIIQDMLAEIKNIILEYNYTEYNVKQIQELNKVFEEIWK